jgi:hypothetical protein
LKRVTISVTVEAATLIARHAGPQEPRWRTVDRLFGRLADLPRGADPAQRRHQDADSAP